MIVCLCHRVSDRDIAHAVRDGVGSFEQLQERTGVSCSCECCRDCAVEIFEQAVGAHAEGNVVAYTTPLRQIRLIPA